MKGGDGSPLLAVHEPHFEGLEVFALMSEVDIVG